MHAKGTTFMCLVENSVEATIIQVTLTYQKNVIATSGLPI